MDYTFSTPHAEDMMRFFRDICAIPHGSGNEQAVAGYLTSFAAQRGLRFHTDGLHNVIIYKDATPGGGAEPVMLQGHTDMVCEKDADCPHDFLSDGIRLIEKDGLLKADGTTLGADNGIGCAMMLAVLASNSLVHPPLECVFTTQEEIGLIGATNLDMSKLSARRMINLDSEDEGVATVSCAGGVLAKFTRGMDSTLCRLFPLDISIAGLRGGHSGMEIIRGLANANKLMGRILMELSSISGFNIVRLAGGTKDNAIPRECLCTAGFNSADERNAALKALPAIAADISGEYKDIEPALSVTWAEKDAGRLHCLPPGGTMAVVKLLYLLPDGVIQRDSARDFVTTSSNLGIAQVENGNVTLSAHPRSSVRSLQQHIMRTFELYAGLLGFELTFEHDYPGWSFSPVSPLRDAFVETYRSLTGNELTLSAIHAGLECGIFAEGLRMQNLHLQGLDAVAIGPNVRGAHTPEETLDIASAERTLELVAKVLERI